MIVHLSIIDCLFYATFASANLNRPAIPRDRRPAKPASGKGLAVLGNLGGNGGVASWASAMKNAVPPSVVQKHSAVPL